VFIISLPRWGYNAEENKVSCATIADELAGPRGDEHDLPRMHKSLFIPDMHLPVSFKDVVELHRSIQYMGQRGLSRRHNRMGNTAPKPRSFRDFIGMQEFAQDRPVDYAFMGAVCNTSDEHGNLSLGSWYTLVYGAAAA